MTPARMPPNRQDRRLKVRKGEVVRLRIVLMGAVLLLVVAVTAVILTMRYGQHLPLPSVLRACEAKTPAGAVKLNDDQMANAATIAAIGIRRSLPDRAIMVALAAALQE